ncbi:MAG TPA: hypothetical protein VH092_06360 [Urbifossiella sp.]|nr:hypothetical protein [Urbifossiella sp.]
MKLYDLDTLTLRSKLNWKVGQLTCIAFSPDGLLGAAAPTTGGWWGGMWVNESAVGKNGTGRPARGL